MALVSSAATVNKFSSTNSSRTSTNALKRLLSSSDGASVETDADLQVFRAELEFIVTLENAGPLVLGVFEQALDVGFQLGGGVAVAEA